MSREWGRSEGLYEEKWAAELCRHRSGAGGHREASSGASGVSLSTVFAASAIEPVKAHLKRGSGSLPTTTDGVRGTLCRTILSSVLLVLGLIMD